MSFGHLKCKQLKQFFIVKQLFKHKGPSFGGFMYAYLHKHECVLVCVYMYESMCIGSTSLCGICDLMLARKCENLRNAIGTEH